jgi:hypothetical protein
MIEKRIQSRVINRHDIAENWENAVDFIPDQGELIIYDNRYIDESTNEEIILPGPVRYKIGDGKTPVNVLPFADQHLIDDYHKKIYGYSGDDLLIIPEGTTKLNTAAYEYSSYKCVIVPDSVKSIGKQAFYCNTSLISIVIGSRVTSIGEEAFYNCKSLTSVVIGNSVESIGKQAFRNCDNLKSFVIPNSITSIGYQAFYECDSLTSLTFLGKTPPDLGDYCFTNTNIQTITVPVESIEAYKTAWPNYADKIDADISYNDAEARYANRDLLDSKADAEHTHNEFADIGHTHTEFANAEHTHNEFKKVLYIESFTDGVLVTSSSYSEATAEQ